MTTSPEHRQLRKDPSRSRARGFVYVIAVLSFSCGLVALVATDGARAVFGATALLLAIAAVWALLGFAPNDELYDVETKAEPSSLPQPPVTETYATEVPPNKSLERTREG
jgi:Na+/proline symporter